MTDKHDLRQAIDLRLSGLTLSPLQQEKLLRRAREEERPVKKKLSLTLTFALLLAVLAATACAAAVRFGVLDYNRHPADNPAYVEHILTINETCESEAFTLTVNDAVFDGTSLSLTMNMQPREKAASVFLYPRVSAVCEGRELNVHVEGGVGLDFLSGFWLPARTPSAWGDGNIGVDFAILGDQVNRVYDPTTQPVTWTVTFDVLTPLWPVEQDTTNLHGDASDMDMDAYEKCFRDAYAQERILLDSLGEVWTFAAILPAPEDIPREDWLYSLRLPDKLTASGAFALTETLTFSLQTDGTELRSLTGGNVYRFGGYEVTFTHLTASFSRADYRFILRKTGDDTAAVREFTEEGMWEFAVFSGGEVLSSRLSEAGPDETGTALIHSGSLSLSSPVTELTFVPLWCPWNGEAQSPRYYDIIRGDAPPTQEQMALAFTVKLE